MDNNNNNDVEESAMVVPGAKEVRLGSVIPMGAKVRIGNIWYKANFLALLLVSQKVQHLQKYLWMDVYGFALVELEGVPVGVKAEHFPEFCLQIEPFPSSEVNADNLFDFIGWYAYMGVLPGTEKCDKILRTKIKAQWMSIKNNRVLKDHLRIIDGFLDLVDCAVAYHCTLSLKEINRIICRWQFGCGERIVGSALSCKQWERLFQFTQHDATIRDNVTEWVKSINGELPDEKFDLFNTMMPHLTMSNIRQVVMNKGFAKMGNINHRNLVDTMEHPKKLVKYNLPNHTMVLHTYGRKESEELEEMEENDEPPKLSGDFSTSINQASNEVARAVLTWQVPPKTDA